MKYWEKIKAHKESNDYIKKLPMWVKFMFVIGFIIGFGIVAVLGGLFFLCIGYFFSLLWNYSVAPVFDVTEMTAWMAGGLLFLLFSSIRFIKFLIKN